ncbi:MAG: hypothetical protein PHV68_07405 [Candidatus Gastranaerophilales bacterium]|nr:hypothetical protein [Candidatus Gastranaerophilales bacterium]
MNNENNEIFSEDIKTLISDAEKFQEKKDVFAEAMKFLFLQSSTNN